jgi:pimeloyl-ACP methyl ester carboxylesterase
MPFIQTNDILTSYQTHGSGAPLVFVHGGFVDSQMWEPQLVHFAQRYHVITYDLRGHGKTGPSRRNSYTIELFADDLKALLDTLGVERAAICGLSLGGMVAQAFAVKYPSVPTALILCNTAASVSLTLSDKIQRYVLFPKWALQLTLRLLDVRRFTAFSFWLARATRSEAWLGRDKATRDYVQRTMLAFQPVEYRKVYSAIYDFRLLNLAAIRAPTLILNGEHESRNVFRHTEAMVRRIPNARSAILPDAGHVANLERPASFNQAVETFLTAVLEHDGA